MNSTNPATGRRPRFTIRALMITIAAVAILLAAIRPVARLFSPLYPDLVKFIERIATLEMGLIVCGVLITAFAMVRLMAEDEKS